MARVMRIGGEIIQLADLPKPKKTRQNRTTAAPAKNNGEPTDPELL